MNYLNGFTHENRLIFQKILLTYGFGVKLWEKVAANLLWVRFSLVVPQKLD